VVVHSADEPAPARSIGTADEMRRFMVAFKEIMATPA
jgi:hypothetical protein